MRRPKRSEWADPTRRGFLLAAAATTSGARGAEAVRLTHTKGEKVAASSGGRPLLEYRYDRARPKPYIHPLYFPDGTRATLDGPEDHVHHRGLMVAWSAVDGIDFWGEVNPAPHGQIVHQRFERLADGNPAVITALNHWLAGGRVHLEERCTLEIHAPRAEGIWLDWESVFTAPQGASLSSGTHPYNGLGIRFVHGMDGGNVLNERGTREIAKANGEAARWCTYYGEAGGVAFFDHPSNPRHPTPFFVMNRPFGYLSAAPTFHDNTFTLKKGEKLGFRWGVLSYSGKPEPGTLDRLFEAWARGGER
ncbi:MAG TPA: PmoA family protein [Bryobacteraceae bacterium]|nr:PmoA family protein [Bryobacteraceae bacterium]